MREQNTDHLDPSSVVWGNLERLARTQVQKWLQILLEEELTSFLGRKRSERLVAVDGVRGYRNGHASRDVWL